MDFSSLLQPLLAAAHAAADRIMLDFSGEKTVYYKNDGSPATATDRDAEAIICKAISALGDFQIVAEEEFEAGLTPRIDPDAPFFLIDALDGTRSFIRNDEDFTVNIALVDKRVPVMGVIVAPVLRRTWHAIAGVGTFRDGQKIVMREAAKQDISLLGGKRSAMPEVLEPFVGEHAVSSRAQRSSSLKFCLLAEGEADLYPRLGETYEWDTAAGDIILREAGGVVLDIATGLPLEYGKQELRFINRGFIAGNRNTFLPKIAIP